jgi:hypothetical protein
MVREVEAFLGGSSEDWFFTRGRNIPAWAYINKVAHADPGRLGWLAAWAPDEPSRCHGWREAVAILAQDTIEAGERDPRAIRRIQLDSLVALELHLITRTGRVAPGALVAMGRECLSAHPDWDPPSEPHAPM